MYVSCQTVVDGGYRSVLLRSDDGAQSFTRFDIPETSGNGSPFIAGISPVDTDRVYVRVYDPAGTRISLTDDGGQTFQQRFQAVGQLLGFAVSPDGAQIAFGGPDDGLRWRFRRDGA